MPHRAGLLLFLMSGSARALNRVLCLHGSGGSASSFLERLAPLRDAAGDAWELRAVDAPAGDGRWWTYPQGERSFTASRYDGAEDSIATVERELASGDYVGLLGFSQGAMLAALVAARCSLGESDASLRFAVLCGAATPKPYDALLTRSREASSSARSLPTLHCLSAVDEMNPRELGESLAACFRHPRAELLWHGAGHTLPPEGEPTSQVLAFMNAHC